MQREFDGIRRRDRRRRSRRAGAAIRLKQLAAERGNDVSVCVIEKAPNSAPTSCRAP
jgi:hypothetical protein